MNLLVLRLSWLGVKLTQLLLPVLWFLAKAAFYLLVTLIVLLVLVIIL